MKKLLADLFPKKEKSRHAAAAKNPVRLPRLRDIHFRSIRARGMFVGSGLVLLAILIALAAYTLSLQAYYYSATRASLQAKAETHFAPLSALRLFFQPPNRFEKPVGIILPRPKGNRMHKGHGGNQPFLLLHPFLVFFLRENIGVIIKKRDGKMGGQCFQHTAAAGSTAAVQQQPRGSIPGKRSNHALHFLLIIPFLHGFSPSCSQVLWESLLTKEFAFYE